MESRLTAEKLEQIVEAGTYDVQRYSGRGMNGKTCPGITVDPHEVIAFVAETVGYEENEDTREDLVMAFSRMHQDNMGLDIICYFPQLLYVDQP